MTPDEFMKKTCEYSIEKYGTDNYGIMPPPCDAQLGLNCLIVHLLGKDWYSFSASNEQANTEAIYEILRRYPKKKSLWKRIKDLFCF